MRSRTRPSLLVGFVLASVVGELVADLTLHGGVLIVDELAHPRGKVGEVGLFELHELEADLLRAFHSVIKNSDQGSNERPAGSLWGPT